MTAMRLFGLWIAGGAGTLARYYLASHLQSTSGVFPFGTLGVNCLGCLLMGLVFELCRLGSISGDWRLWLTVGFLGGFTTFSAFAMDTWVLARNQETAWAWGYVLASVLGGLALAWGGGWLGRLLFSTST